ncbi:MAG: hypothetical protein V1850_06950 [Candidatus Bathyarchaeota archaeon]
MAFLIRRPFVYIIIGIVALVLVIQFSGILNPKPTIAITTSLSASSIKMNTNATLTVVIENKGSKQYSVEYHIVGTFASDQLQFYDKITSVVLTPSTTGNNYTINYSSPRKMNTGEQWTISVYVKGLNPKATAYAYTIYLEAWADGALADRKIVQLTVTQS